MKLVEKVIKENLTWKQAIREMNEEYSYVISDWILRGNENKIVFLTNEEEQLFLIDSHLERVYPIPFIEELHNHRYSTVKITDEALKLLKLELYK